MESSSLCSASLAEGKNSEAVRGSNSTLIDHDNSLDKLNTRVSSNLQIRDGNRTKNTIGVHKVRVNGYCIDEKVEVEDEDEDEDDLSEEALLEQMGYGRSEPKRNFIEEEEEEEDEDEDEEEDLSEESFLAQMGYLKNEPPKHEPITTPIADLHLVSAFKGSREKEGKPRKECRVSWAPDVYDPPPTSDDHFVMNKTERHKNEHKVKGAAGKNRQKSGGKWAGASEDIGVGGGGKGGKGGGKKEAAPAGKDKGGKKYGDKKQGKKRGGSGGGGGKSKYSDSGVTATVARRSTSRRERLRKPGDL